jgi:hypothetical protein
MALHDKEQREMDREDGLVQERPAVVLLRHIHELWPDGKSFLPTSELIDMLEIAHPSVWGKDGPFGSALTAKRLGGMLTKSYKIHSAQPVRGGPRGYHLASFVKPWHRMGVTPLPQSDERDASDESDAGSPGDVGPADKSGNGAAPNFEDLLAAADDEPTCGWCDHELIFETEKRLQTCTHCQPVHGNFQPDDEATA